MLRAFLLNVGFLSCCLTFIALYSVILKNQRLYCNNNHDDNDNNINNINSNKFHFKMVTYLQN